VTQVVLSSIVGDSLEKLTCCNFVVAGDGKEFYGETSAKLSGFDAFFENDGRHVSLRLNLRVGVNTLNLRYATAHIKVTLALRQLPDGRAALLCYLAEESEQLRAFAGTLPSAAERTAAPMSAYIALLGEEDLIVPLYQEVVGKSLLTACGHNDLLTNRECFRAMRVECGLQHGYSGLAEHLMDPASEGYEPFLLARHSAGFGRGEGNKRALALFEAPSTQGESRKSSRRSTPSE
jgi:hypothetical protein